MTKRNLIISLYVGAIALSVATLSMSLAWYATASRLRIESVNITIDCDRQLAISTSRDTGYVSELNKGDLNDPGAFYPVTSGHDEWLSTDKDMPEFYFDTTYTEVESAELSTLATMGYFSQKLYLKADDDVRVSINPEETFIHPNEEYNNSYAQELHNRDSSYTVEQYKEKLATLVKSMRYSILINEPGVTNRFIMIDPNKNDETYYGDILDSNADDYYDYFKKESDGKLYERVYGEYSGTVIYDDPLDADSIYEYASEEPSAFNAKHKKGVYRFNREKSISEGGLVFKKEVTHTLDEFNASVKPFYIPVYVDHPTEIVLSIYIEGWDRDSVNYNMGATFTSNITFKVQEEM